MSTFTDQLWPSLTRRMVLSVNLLWPWSLAVGQDVAGNLEHRFEVASIRPTASQADEVYIKNDQAGMRTSNTSLFMLITYACGVQRYQVIGADGWVRDLRWDITAKHEQAEEGLIPAEDQVRQASKDERTRTRLRHLLAERFHLKLRRDLKELPIYSLAIDKEVHKMKAAVSAGGRINVNQNKGSGKLRGEGATTKRLAESLSNIVGRPVVDETGLKGLFGMDVVWSDNSSADEAGPTIFTALREQMGLRLESKKGPVVTYVVERAERPSEN